MSRPAPAEPRATALAAFLAAAALALAGLAFHHSPWAERASLAMLDTGFGLLRAFAGKPAPDDMLIVGMDDPGAVAPEVDPVGPMLRKLPEVLVQVARGGPRAIVRRNEIVRRCRTEYLLVLDDDQTVPDNIGALADVLDERPDLGGISCIWLEKSGRKCTACGVRVGGRRIVKEGASDKQVLATRGGLRYVLFDFVQNSTLFRMACLADQAWDPFYKIGKEHLDFFLSHQKLAHWKFAVSLDVVIGHHPEGETADYSEFRHGERVRTSERYFLEKFGVDEVIEGRKYIDEQGAVGAIRSRWKSLLKR